MTFNNVTNFVPKILGTTNEIVVTPSGTPSGTTLTLSLASEIITQNSIFHAYLSATATNATGDGTAYPFAGNMTTINQGGAYNTGTFAYTAPVTGNYQFSCGINFSAGTIMGDPTVTLITTGGTYILVGPLLAGNVVLYGATGTIIVPMTAGDTASISATASGGTKSVSIVGGISQSFFEGHLL